MRVRGGGGCGRKGKERGLEGQKEVASWDGGMLCATLSGCCEGRNADDESIAYKL